MPRKSKEDKRIENATNDAFRKFGSNRKFDIFDLSKITQAGSNAGKLGQDIEAAVADACNKYEIK